MYGYARKQRLQDADAADLCQEVFRAVAGAVGRLEYDPRRGSFRNGLFTVIRRPTMAGVRERLHETRSPLRSATVDADAPAEKNR